MNKIKYLIFCCLPIFLFGHYTQDSYKKVSVQLKWKHQFQFAGFYIAKEKGFYKRVGLDVDIKEWKYGINVAQEVELGKSQYGVSRPSCLIDISKGKNLILLAALYQSSPVVILADKKSGIDSIKKFKNKKIMITKEHFRNPSLIAMLNSQGVNFEDMEIVNYTFTHKDLLDKTVDLMTSYSSNELYATKNLKMDPVVFEPRKYGFDFYSDLLISHRKYFENNKEEVKNFIAATLEGFEYAFKHKEETVSLILKKYNSLKKTEKALMYEANVLEKLAYYKNGKIGHISPKRLEKIYDVYKLFGLVQHDIDMEDIEYNELFSGLHLTQDEKEYLSEKKEIKLCVDPEWMPFEKVDENGQHVGVSADYFDILRELLSVNFKVVNTSSWAESLSFIKKGKCDILPLSMKLDKQNEYLNFTTPYYDFPIVVVTKNDVAFIDSARDLQGKKIATIKGCYSKEILNKKYSNMNIEEVQNSQVGLDKVDNGEVFAFVDSLPSVTYAIQLNQYDSLKISGKLFEKLKLSVAVRNDDKVLLDIMQKAVNNVTLEQKQKILSKWMPIKYEEGINSALMIKIILIMMTFLSVIIYWNRKISQTNALLKESKKEIEAKNRELKRLATTDKLTSLYNRLKIDEILQNEINRSQRYDVSFGVCLLDIDFFKRVNDAHGHQVGDRVLIEISHILRTLLRRTDYIGRWGGEEFLVIFPQIDKDEMVRIVEKIRVEIKKEPIDEAGIITSSFGVTKYIQGDNMESIIQRADIALYTAKNSGRDKVVVN